MMFTEIVGLSFSLFFLTMIFIVIGYMIYNYKEILDIIKWNIRRS